VRRERNSRLTFSTKLYQGIGAIPDTVKNWSFNTFTLLFYNQVLGVDAFFVSIALAIEIVFDAITDPLVASFSDNSKTRWGRRHPLMLIASLPLGAALGWPPRRARMPAWRAVGPAAPGPGREPATRCRSPDFRPAPARLAKIARYAYS